MSQLEGGTLAGGSPQLSLASLGASGGESRDSPLHVRVASIDVDRTTPLEALQLLGELKKLV